MKQNNQGFSLVELLVALSIMSVLGSMIVVSLGILPRTAAKSCANELKTIIGQTRIQTMGKKETVLELIHDSSDNAFYTLIKTDGVEGQREQCGKSTVKVFIHDTKADEGVFEELEPGKKFVIVFDRSTGKEKAGGINIATPVTYANPLQCDAIKISGGTATYLIQIYPATGKISMKME